MYLSNNYLLCVSCMTYNQSAYITDAMNGFCMQQTNFPFVCTIVDDASTDGEQEVIRQYLNDNFDLQDASIAYEKDEAYGHVAFARHKTNVNCFFAVVYLNENHYSQRKPKAPYLKEWTDNVKYIALCEGDDYWTDPLKLQKQVRYMENHNECCMTACAASWEENGRFENKGCQHKVECDLSTDEVIRKGGYYLATASLVYRTELNNDRPEWREKANVGDYPLQVLGTLRGHLHFFPEVMCVYRYMVEGSFSDKNKVWPPEYLKAKIFWMKMLDNDTKHKYSHAIYFNLVYTCYRKLFRMSLINFGEYIYVIMKSDHKYYNISLLREDIAIRSNNKRIALD